jgi:multicomponent Na+:H+ antiporter subunit F
MSVVFIIVFGLLTLSFLLAFVRLLRGPHLPDRVIALDLISMIIAGMIAAYSVRMNEPMFLDVITVMAIITFFGTVAFARYLEKRRVDD